MMVLMQFGDIAVAAGFVANLDGKFNLPATQETADKLAAASVSLLPVWNPGQESVDITITGAAPVWGWLCIAHALHGRVRKLEYAAPNAPSIVVYAHGA